MADWVDIINPDELMQGYQKSSDESTRMPGIGSYLETITHQNNEIIGLLVRLIVAIEGKSK